jgi:predicted Zn finger-like uncharacterized protein
MKILLLIVFVLATANAFVPRQQAILSRALFSSPQQSEPSTTSIAETPSTPATVPTLDASSLPDSYVRCGKCQSVYAFQESDLGSRGKGRRLECSVCHHSWFQSKDRILLKKDGYEMVPLPPADLARIQANMMEGKSANYVGDCKLYVGNIAFECHEDDLYQVFSQIGPVGEVSLVRDDDGRPRGFGFVTFRNKEDGEKAMNELNGMAVRGRSIAVRESNNN